MKHRRLDQQPTVAGWMRGLLLLLIQSLSDLLTLEHCVTLEHITYWGPLSEMLLIASSHTHRQAPEGCWQECVHYDVQVCFITIDVLHSPWRRPKSLWASVSCFRCSVMEICQRKIKTQLEWYDVCHGWTLWLICVGLNSLYFCKKQTAFCWHLNEYIRSNWMKSYFFNKRQHLGPDLLKVCV